MFKGREMRGPGWNGLIRSARSSRRRQPLIPPWLRISPFPSKASCCANLICRRGRAGDGATINLASCALSHRAEKPGPRSQPQKPLRLRVIALKLFIISQKPSCRSYPHILCSSSPLSKAPASQPTSKTFASSRHCVKALHHLPKTILPLSS